MSFINLVVFEYFIRAIIKRVRDMIVKKEVINNNFAVNVLHGPSIIYKLIQIYIKMLDLL